MATGNPADSAEASLVGALLLGETCPDEIRPEAFLSPRLREIATAALYLRDRGISPNAVLVHDALQERGCNAIGLGELAELADAHKLWHKPSELWGRVQEAARTRRVLAVLGEAQGLSQNMGADDLVAALVERLTACDTGTNDGTRTIAAIARETVADLTARYQAGKDGVPYGVSTGLGDLDNALGGVTPGCVTIVAGRPSMGKSALARTVAMNANANGLGVHVFSPEDRAQTYAMRCLSDVSGVPLGALRAMSVNTMQWRGVVDAADQLTRREHWLVDDSAGLSAQQVGMRIRRHKRANQTRLVVVDYVQLLRERQVKTRFEAVGQSITGLAKIARDEDVAMVVLSQLSRESEKRDSKRPQLSDLRESGELEQVAETVVLMHRPAYYEPNDAKWQGKGLAIVAKHKNGCTGDVVLAWDGPTATYRNWSAS